MAGENTNLVIDWPCWWKGAGHHLLEGMPFIGTHCRIIKDVRSRLNLRDDALFDDIWKKQGYSAELCRFVTFKAGEILRKYIAWPNHLFFPEDRIALLFGVIPGVWFDSEDPVEEVRQHFNLAGLKDNDTTYYDVVLNGRFKEFVSLVETSQGRAGKGVAGIVVASQ